MRLNNAPGPHTVGVLVRSNRCSCMYNLESISALCRLTGRGVRAPNDLDKGEYHTLALCPELAGTPTIRVNTDMKQGEADNQPTRLSKTFVRVAKMIYRCRSAIHFEVTYTRIAVEPGAPRRRAGGSGLGQACPNQIPLRNRESRTANGAGKEDQQITFVIHLASHRTGRTRTCRIFHIISAP